MRDSEALGAGWRIGFLGSLHCSVFQDRLRQEHGSSVIITEPAVQTKVMWRDGTEEILQSPIDFPDADEPRARASVAGHPAGRRPDHPGVTEREHGWADRGGRRLSLVARVAGRISGPRFCGLFGVEEGDVVAVAECVGD